MKISTLLCLVLLAIVSKTISQPVITSFAQTFANVGDTNTIIGKNFNAIPDSNIVRFGAVTAKVSAASSTKLSVTVPVGATYGVITVSVNHLTAYTSIYFTPSMGCKSGYNTTFGSPIDSVFNYNTPFIARDFDGDGKVDMANVFDSHLNIKLNASKPSLFSGAMIMQYNGVGSNATYLTEGDLNGDGKLDILSANDDTISILKNESTLGNISFTKTSFITSFVAGNAVIADFDGDGKPDVIITNGNNYDSVFAVFRNIGSNGEIAFAKEQDFNTTISGISNIAVADFDGDGKPDIVVSGFYPYSGTAVWVLKNTAKNKVISFSKPAQVSISLKDGTSISQIVQLAVGDFDGDGKTDIALGCSGSNFETIVLGVYLLKNKSTTKQISFDSLQIAGNGVGLWGGNGGASATIYGFTIADIDGDGKPDILYSYSLTDSGWRPFYYFEAIKNTCTSNSISFTDINYQLQPSAVYPIQVADMDGDGMPDIVCGAEIFFGTCTLPLNLLNFTAKPNDNQVALQWQTANEVNTAKFTIERSTDGSQFGAIGTVSANGNTTTSTYKFADVLPSATELYYYYRLKMIDNTGKYTYSSIVKVAVSTSANNIRIAPNPFVGGLALTINSTENTNATLIITSIDGKVLSDKKYTLSLGNNSLVVNETNKLAEGIYLLTILMGNDKKTLRIEKQ